MSILLTLLIALFASAADAGPTTTGTASTTVDEWKDAVKARESYLLELKARQSEQEARILQLEERLVVLRKAPAAEDISSKEGVVTTSSTNKASGSSASKTTNYLSSHRSCPLSLSTPELEVPQLPSESGCVTHSVLLSTICQISLLHVNKELIQVARGGEKLESVMGQEEDVEYPKYS